VRLYTAPGRVVVPLVPVPLGDALDAIVERFLGGPTRATARSRIVAATILARGLQPASLARLIDNYRRASVADGSMRSINAAGSHVFSQFAAGPRHRQTRTASVRLRAGNPLKDPGRFRAIALFLPFPISERLDLFVATMPGRPAGGGRPVIHKTSRQEFIAALILWAKQQPGSVPGWLDSYMHAQVHRVQRELPSTSGVISCRRYGPGPRPPD
jgi:hypothetical protein